MEALGRRTRAIWRRPSSWYGEQEGLWLLRFHKRLLPLPKTICPTWQLRAEGREKGGGESDIFTSLRESEASGPS